MVNSRESRFRIVRVKREELIVQCKKDDFEIWGKDMTLTEYQAEEKLQRETAHSQRGLMVWALMERYPSRGGGVFGAEEDLDDSDVRPGDTAIICHCESHTFDCMLRTLSGDVVRGHSYHVNAVYTLPAYRRQGLASFFLKAVKQQLAKQPKSVASVLYSDIGPDFYNRLGWETQGSLVAVINVTNSRRLLDEDEGVNQDPEPLYLNQRLDALMANEHSRLEASLLYHENTEKLEVFAVLPTRECLEWQFCSGIFHAYVRGHAASPSQCGAQLGDSFILWTHDFRSSTLFVSYMSYSNGQPETVLALLRAAVAEAERFGLAHVEAWDPQPVMRSSLVTAQLSVTFGERTDSISSLMLFKHMRDDPNSEVLPIWIHNERFPWV